MSPALRHSSQCAPINQPWSGLRVCWPCTMACSRSARFCCSQRLDFLCREPAAGVCDLINALRPLALHHKGSAVQVEAYLEAFADRFDLHQYTRYETRVLTVRPLQAAAAAEPAAWHGNGHRARSTQDVTSHLANGNGPSHRHTNGNGAVRSHDPSGLPRWQITTAHANPEVCFCST